MMMLALSALLLSAKSAPTPSPSNGFTDEQDFIDQINTCATDSGCTTLSFSSPYPGQELVEITFGMFSGSWAFRMHYLFMGCPAELTSELFCNIETIDQGALDDLQSVYAIDLMYNEMTTISDGIFTHLGGLGVLELSYNKIHTIASNAFPPSIQYVFLIANQLTSINGAAFSNKQNLGSVDLRENMIVQVESNTFTNIPRLVHVYLQDNAITTVSVDAFDGTNVMLPGQISYPNGTIMTPEMNFDGHRVDLRNNDIDAIRSGVFNVLDSLERLRLGFNSIRTLEADAFRGMHELSLLELDHNYITRIETGTFANLSSLEFLYLNHNAIEVIESRALEGLLSASTVMLHANLIREVQSNAFASSNILQLSLADSKATHTVVLEPSAFAGCCGDGASSRAREGMIFCNVSAPGVYDMHPREVSISGSGTTALQQCTRRRISLGGLRVATIPADCFFGARDMAIDLRRLGITRIEDDAFRGTANLQILLEENSVAYMSHRAFPAPAVMGYACVDFEDYSVYFPELRDMFLTSQEIVSAGDDREAAMRKFGLQDSGIYNCSSISEMGDAQDPIGQGLLLSSTDDEGATPFDACCAFGGGYAHGRSLTMDEYSDVYCWPDTKFSHNVTCACGCTGCIYDLTSDTCISVVPDGHFFTEYNGGLIEGVKSSQSVGFFDPCASGTIGRGSTPETARACTSCAAGTFSALSAATECVACEPNTFSAEASSACVACGWGKSSSEAQASCSACSFAMIGSEHCDVPVLGITVGVLAALVLGIVYYARRRAMQMNAERIKARDRVISAYHDDINLMSGAWKIDPSDVHCKKRLAAGGYGEVWSGVLRSRYEVAIKIMFDSANVDLDRDDEIRFLQRARHKRLVMFLGCGRGRVVDSDGQDGPTTPDDAADRNIFVVLELCDKGDLHGLLSKSKKKPAWDQRLSLLADVCEGMAYLHFVHNSIHRDLKSMNCLLSVEDGGALRAKVADFGLSKIVRRAETTSETPTKEGDRTANHLRRHASSGTNAESALHTSNKGTPYMMAPELLTHRREKTSMYSRKVDNYAFGMIIHEAIALELPWCEENFNYKIFENVKASKRPPIADDLKARAPPALVKLMVDMYAQDPETRPEFNTALDIINEMRKNLHVASLASPTSSSRTSTDDLSTIKIVASSKEQGAHVTPASADAGVELARM
eukprot:g2068.t1